MVILILLLVVGLGLIIMGLAKFIVRSPNLKTTNNKTVAGNGGLFMQNNGWLRLALFSFVGIIIAVVILSFMTPGGVFGTNNMAAHGNMQPGINMQGGMGTGAMMSMPRGSMQMQDGMNGMGYMNMSTSMGGTQSDMNTMIVHRLNQMQMQINQLQQMMMTNMGGMQMQSMPQGGTGGMGGGGMGMMNMMPMGGSGGGMGMM